MLITDVLAGVLTITYVFMFWLSIASYKLSRERRIMVSAVIFIGLLVKNIYVIFLAFEGTTPEVWHFAIDLTGILIIVILWKWKG